MSTNGASSCTTLEGVVNSYAEDAILVAPDGTAQGRAAILELLSRDKAAFPERHVTVDVIVEQGDTIASEFTWVATHTGPLVMPDGPRRTAHRCGRGYVR